MAPRQRAARDMSDPLSLSDRLAAERAVLASERTVLGSFVRAGHPPRAS